MVDIGRLYIIATIDWRTAPIGRFALFRALRQVTSANQAQARAGTAARRPAQITRLAATRYDLPAVPLRAGLCCHARNGVIRIARHATKGVHPMTYVIAEPCIDVKDKSCIEECPVDCIYEGDRMLYIHPDECVDCGACEPVCPVEAIFYEDDVPAQWKDFTATNAAFFEELGSPGGAAKVGPQPRDTDYVANYQPTE